MVTALGSGRSLRFLSLWHDKLLLFLHQSTPVNRLRACQWASRTS